MRKRVDLFCLMLVASLCSRFCAEQKPPYVHLERPAINSEQVENESPTLVSASQRTGPGAKVPGKLRLASVALEADPTLIFRFSLIQAELSRTHSTEKRLQFSSTLTPRLGKNFSHIFDPLYISQSQQFLFKFGGVRGTTVGYKLMLYKPGDKAARPLLRRRIGGESGPNPDTGLRNKDIRLSPDGKYLAFVVGGAYNGPDHAYFPEPLELWVCRIATGEAQFVARGDAVFGSYGWRDGSTLIFSNISGPRRVPRVRTYRFDAKSGRSRLLQEEAHASQWLATPFLRDLHRELLEAGAAHATLSKLARQSRPFPLSKYSQGSMRLDPGSRAVYFFVDATPPSVAEAANRTGNGQMKLTMELWKHEIGAPLPSRVVAMSIQTFNYEPTVTYLFSSAASHCVLVRRFTGQRSPINSPVEADHPQKVFSLMKLEGGKSQELWSVVDGAGLSASTDGRSSTLLNY